MSYNRKQNDKKHGKGRYERDRVEKTLSRQRKLEKNKQKRGDY